MSSDDSDNNSRGDAAAPRRSQRKKKMSLRAVEHVALKPRNFSTDDENKLDDYIDLCQASRDCKVLLEKQSLIESMAKTPHSVRSKIREALTKVSDDSTEDEFATDEDSEYQADDTDGSCTDASDSSSSFDEEAVKPIKTTNLKTTKLGTTKKNQYLIKADDFFSNNSSKKALTSNHTLDKLEMPRLAQTELQKIISAMKLTDEHDKCLNDLIEMHRSYFSKWWCLLHENYNILLYGLGSKRNILQMFQKDCLVNSTTIVVNGFFPKLSIKEVVESIIVDVLHLKDTPANIYEACDLIKRSYESQNLVHLYIIVHNIDGEMLQNNKSQSILANLASVRNIHLIASIDHINAPLIWDFYKLSKFNFSWWDTTSFLPYIKETAFESSMMVQNTGSLTLSALNNVFLSLTTNSKGIFNIIVKHQLENSNQYYQGLLFKDLYLLCREAFLVSSDLALRAQLNEFVDHKMVKYKRSIDGSETLVIPISNSLLQQFLDSQSN